MTRAANNWIALLGRRDEPVDGVEDYCTFLAQALESCGVELTPVRVEWASLGRAQALERLSSQAAEWRGCWVLLQYTALGWSRRGFPFYAWRVVAALRRKGARIAIVFHEPTRQGDSWPRLIDRIRGASQDRVIRRLYHAADRCIIVEPLQRIRWLPKQDAKTAFIPIGANIPESAERSEREPSTAAKTVSVFCVADPPNRTREVGDVARAARVVVANGIRLKVVFIGRGTAEARHDIESTLQDSGAEVSILGLRPASEVSRVLAESDAMLYVRGFVDLRRGSVIAGIACGLPIVGYGGAAEATPLAEAGLELVPYRDTDALGAALARVLADDGLRQALREKSLLAQKRHFSWQAIAAAFTRALDGTS